MARCLEHHGGEILLNAEVEKIEVENNETGGIVLQNGERIEATRIVSNAHVHTTLFKIDRRGKSARRFSGKNRKRPHRQRFRNDRPLRRFRTARLHSRAKRRSFRAIVITVCSFSVLRWIISKNYADYLNGIPSKNPGALAMTFSSVDPTLAPQENTRFSSGGSITLTNWQTASVGKTFRNAKPIN
jgi:phytoene dehydrogenase-like protein